MSLTLQAVKGEDIVSWDNFVNMSPAEFQTKLGNYYIGWIKLYICEYYNKFLEGEHEL